MHKIKDIYHIPNLIESIVLSTFVYFNLCLYIQVQSSDCVAWEMVVLLPKALDFPIQL